MTATDWANADPVFWSWLAGFIDGDGCFTLSRRTRDDALFGANFNGMISISQYKNRSWVCDYIKKITGIGTVINITTTSNFGDSSGKRWLVSRQSDIISIIEMIYSHLIIKKNDGRLLLKAINLMSTRKTQYYTRGVFDELDKIYHKMKKGAGGMRKK